MKKITIFTGVFNEEETVREVYEVIRKVFEGLADRYTYEHLFMDNCSTDNTLEILREIASKDKNVKVLSYSKNFAPFKSEMIGFRHATGDAVISFEANLKDPPELIPALLERWEEGYQVVYGVRTRTGDRLVMRLMRKAYYRIIRAIATEELPVDAGSFRVVDRVVVDELVKLDDYKPYVRGLITSIGFKQVGIEYTRRPRPRGRSKSSLGYLIDFAINSMVSYSIMPMRLCTLLGITIAALSFLMSVVYVILKVFSVWKAQIPAVAGLIVLFLFFSGIQLVFLGVIGEYVGAIHGQVRKKPYVVIREKINIED
jgi:polyisoprenyl-phosphate glycosyltransferase